VCECVDATPCDVMCVSVVLCVCVNATPCDVCACVCVSV
jgi:hypothetical protein